MSLPSTHHAPFAWPASVPCDSEANDILATLTESRRSVHYDSQAFTSQFAPNPLVASAAALFFMIEQIVYLKQIPDILKLRAALQHELKAFKSQAKDHAYPWQVIQGAHHILCSWIDQVIYPTQREKTQGDTIRFGQLPDAEQEAAFYTLLQHCTQDSDRYIDLLEFLYICFSLGFQIKPASFALQAADHFRLLKTKTYLWDVIQARHKNLPCALWVVPEEKTPPNADTKHTQKTYLASLGLGILGMVFCLGGYLLFNQKLDSVLIRMQNTPMHTEQASGPYES